MKMTSKEALEEIEEHLNSLGYDIEEGSTTNPFWDNLDILEEDLERLEKLEKVIKILKNNFVYNFELSYDTPSVIKIYVETRYDEIIPFAVKNKEEFELLKEVLKNDK